MACTWRWLAPVQITKVIGERSDAGEVENPDVGGFFGFGGSDGQQPGRGGDFNFGSVGIGLPSEHAPEAMVQQRDGAVLKASAFRQAQDSARLGRRQNYVAPRGSR